MTGMSHDETMLLISKGLRHYSQSLWREIRFSGLWEQALARLPPVSISGIYHPRAVPGGALALGRTLFPCAETCA